VADALDAPPWMDGTVTVLQCVCEAWQVEYRESDWTGQAFRYDHGTGIGVPMARAVLLMLEVEDAIRVHADEPCMALRFALVSQGEAFAMWREPEPASADDLDGEDLAPEDLEPSADDLGSVDPTLGD